jgi:hypothetical protein
MLLNDMSATQRWAYLVGMNLERAVFHRRWRAGKGMVWLALGLLFYALGQFPAVQAWGGHVSAWWSG